MEDFSANEKTVKVGDKMYIYRGNAKKQMCVVTEVWAENKEEHIEAGFRVQPIVKYGDTGTYEYKNYEIGDLIFKCQNKSLK